MAAIYQYSFLSSMFWTNSLAICLTRTLFSLRSVTLATKKSYVAYTVYSFGAPLLITLLTLYLSFENTHGELFARPVYRQKYICFLEETIVIYAFFLCPIYAIVTINIALCIAVMVRVTRRGGIASSDKNRVHKKVITCFKLSASLGFGWILFFVYAILPEVWPVMQAFVELQGVFVVSAHMLKWKCVSAMRTRLSVMGSTRGTTDMTTANSSHKRPVSIIKGEHL